MHLSAEQTRWLLKVLQPEKTLGSLPGSVALTEAVRAALVGLPLDIYTAQLAQMREEANVAARELSADPLVAAMIERLPVEPGSRVFAFGDSHTSDPQSWAVLLNEVLAAKGVSITVDAVPGDTTTHGLIRVGQLIAQRPSWVLFFLGTNDARTQGPSPQKTLVDPAESARNLRELRHRVQNETEARCLWITPPAVNEEQVKHHGGLARFGVRFRNEDLARVQAAVHELGDPVVDLVSLLRTPPRAEAMMDDGLHFTVEGQMQVAREVLRRWSALG